MLRVCPGKKFDVDPDSLLQEKILEFSAWTMTRCTFCTNLWSALNNFHGSVQQIVPNRSSFTWPLRLYDIFLFTSSFYHHSKSSGGAGKHQSNELKSRCSREETGSAYRIDQSKQVKWILLFAQETSMLMRVWLEKLRENIIHSLSTYFNQQGSLLSAFIFLSFLPVTLSKSCCCNCATCVVRSFHFMFFLLILKTYKTTQLSLDRRVFERWHCEC